MAKICKCDNCGTEGAPYVGYNYSKQPFPYGEKFSGDLCTNCADVALRPLRDIVARRDANMLAAQVVK